jgi:hypothetical protein
MTPVSFRPLSTQSPDSSSVSRAGWSVVSLTHRKFLRNVVGLFMVVLLYTELVRVLGVLTPYSIASSINVTDWTVMDVLKTIGQLLLTYIRWVYLSIFVIFLIAGLLEWRLIRVNRHTVTLLGIGTGLICVPLFVWGQNDIDTFAHLNALIHALAPYFLGTNYVPGLDLWFPWAAGWVFVGSCGMAGRLLYSHRVNTPTPTVKRWDDWLWEIAGVLVLMTIFAIGSKGERTYLDYPIVKDGFVLTITDMTIQSAPDPTQQRLILELQATNTGMERLSLNSQRTVLPYAFKVLDQFGAEYEGTAMDRMPEIGETEIYRGLPFFGGTYGSKTRVWMVFDLPLTSVPLAIFHEYHGSSFNVETQPYLVMLSPSPYALPETPSVPPLLPSPRSSYYLDVERVQDYMPAPAEELTSSRAVVVKVELRDVETRSVSDESGYMVLIDTNGFWYEPNQSTRFSPEYQVHENYPYWSDYRGGQEVFVIPLDAEPQWLLFQNFDGLRVVASLSD